MMRLEKGDGSWTFVECLVLALTSCVMAAAFGCRQATVPRRAGAASTSQASRAGIGLTQVGGWIRETTPTPTPNDQNYQPNPNPRNRTPNNRDRGLKEEDQLLKFAVTLQLLRQT